MRVRTLTRPTTIRAGVCAAVLLLILIATVNQATPLSEAASWQPSDAPQSEYVASLPTGARESEATLITGDVVTYTTTADGHVAFEVRPALRADGADVTFFGEGDAEAFYVYPSDALPYFNTGRIDRELFNVSTLTANEAAGDGVPVILTFAEDLTTDQLAGEADALPATAAPVPAEVVNGAGVTVDPARAGDFWNAVVEPSGQVGSAAFEAGIAGLRLDRTYAITLDESVPQVGAPAAWEAGFTGEGVTVAVLDTGVDAAHPDLAGQVIEQVDFTGEDEPGDLHGHGTHVAATIAGTGAASDGVYAGVAPEATILSGRVCDSDGSCAESAILAAMDWAAQSGAQVVNMSLGGEPTDGTDPVSQAVNDLTAAHGTLFVISAGNDGGSASNPQRVGSPGTADAALTVAAVDTGDDLASFSSRGPRVGDYAPKPEISAPGVDITAAESGGTGHQTMSGTSMAAPHVAGAAALVAQARPDLDPAALKDLLVSTAKDIGFLPFEQGTGRLDIPAALEHDLYAAATMAFGDLSEATAPVERELTYTNMGDAPVALDLAGALSDLTGDPAAGPTLSADTVTVPARGQASVTVTVDPEAAQGIFNGVLTATGEGVSLRTALSFGTIASHEITIAALDREGKPACDECVGLFYLWHDSWSDTRLGNALYMMQPVDGAATAHVPTGTYSVIATIWQEETDADDAQLTWLTELDVTIDGDTEIVLDGRDTVPLEPPSVPDKETQVRSAPHSLCHETWSGRNWCGFAADSSGNQFVNSMSFDVYMTPTPRPKLKETYLWARWVLAEPQELQPMRNQSGDPEYYSAAPDYLYQLAFRYDEGIPDGFERKLTRRDLVRVPVHYHADQRGTLIATARHARPPTSGLFTVPWVYHEPGKVTEYYLADDQFVWWRTDWQRYVPGPDSPEDRLIMVERDAFPRSAGGTRRELEQRYQAPFGHGVVESRPQYWEVFEGGSFSEDPAAVLPAAMTRGSSAETVDQFLPPSCFMDNGMPHRYACDGRTATSWRMWNHDTGTELNSVHDELGFPIFEGLSGKAATYRLQETFAYPEWMTEAPYFRTKTEATTTWTFRSAPTRGEELPRGYQCGTNATADPEFLGWENQCLIQPLIQLHYDLGLDTYNQAAAGRAHTVTVYAGAHSGAVDDSEVTEVAMEVSFDGGRTWVEARKLSELQDGSSPSEQAQQFLIQHPPLHRTDGYVGLRITATDANGGSIESEVQRAYVLK